MIDPITTNTARVGELPNEPFSLSDKIPHEVGIDLKSGTVQQLVDLVSNVIDATGGVGFRAVSVADGQTLPATTTQEFILLGKGTYYNVSGGDTIVLTKELNAVVSNGSFWFIGVEIDINAEDLGIVQTIRQGFLETTPSENAIYNAIEIINSALNSKENTIASGTTAQYYRGDKTWQTLTTSSVPEGSRQYFTNQRVTLAPLDGFTVLTDSSLAESDLLIGGLGKVQGQINARAPIDSPSFTGSATSPAFITQGGTSLQFVDGTGGLQNKSQFQNAISGTADYLTKFGIGGVVQSIISENGYAIGINGNDLNPNIGDPKHAFDVTNNAGDNFQYLAQFTGYANSAGLSNFHIRKARGTSAAPLAVQNQDILVSFGFRGYATNKFASSSIAIQAIAEENFTNTSNGTSLLFQTTPIGNFDSRVDALKLQANGSFLFFKGGEVVSPSTSSPSLTLKGGSTIGSSDAQSGELVVGSNSLYRGKFSYNGQEGKLYIDNSYNDTNGDIIFRTKSNATPINALIIKGEGNIQANGNISASPAELPNHVVVKSQLDAAFSSGTYTPTASNFSNCSSFILDEAIYSKIGNIVNVKVSFTISVTAANTITQVAITLPFNRTTTTNRSVGSVSGQTPSDVLTNGIVFTFPSDSTKAVMSSKPTATGSTSFVMNFTYSIN